MLLFTLLLNLVHRFNTIIVIAQKLRCTSVLLWTLLTVGTVWTLRAGIWATLAAGLEITSNLIVADGLFTNIYFNDEIDISDVVKRLFSQSKKTN